MARRVDPLNDKVPIVDAEGRPTGEFMLKWQQQKVANDGIPSTAAELSTLLDKFGGTEGAILLRGASEWAELPSPGGTSQFLRADGTYATPPSALVDSVFGRTGAVVAAASDYDADQVDYDNTSSGLAATDVQAAIDEVSAAGGAVDSVNGQTGTVVLDPDDLDDSATTNKFTTAGDISKLAGIETDATADQTGAEIKTAYEAEANTNAYTDAEKAKLAGVESGAEVNDVDSVFGRTGAVVAAASDYDADQVDYDNATSGLTATDVQAAIDEVEAEKQPLLKILAVEDASGTSIPNNTLTSLSYSTTTRDDFGGSAWDGTTFTVPADGVYDLSAVGITTGPDSSVLIEFIKNGTTSIALIGASGSNSLHTGAVVSLSASDTVIVRVRQTTGSTRTGRTDAAFSVVQLA